jgi:hypothetical protein
VRQALKQPGLYTDPIPMEPVAVSFALAKREVVATTRALATRRRRWWLYPIAGAELLAVGIAISDDILATLAAVMLATWIGCAYLLGPVQTWERTEHGTQWLLFEPGGVSSRLPSAESRFSWDYFRSILLVGDVYVLVGQRGLIYLPRRVFADKAAESDFRDMLGRPLAGQLPRH